MDAYHPARADPGSACFSPETGRVSAVIYRELAFSENFFAMNICHRSLGGRDEIKLAQCCRVQTFLNSVILIDEFWELSNAFKALSPNHERGRYLSVAMLGRMQIQHELN